VPPAASCVKNCPSGINPSISLDALIVSIPLLSGTNTSIPWSFCTWL